MNPLTKPSLYDWLRGVYNMDDFQQTLDKFSVPQPEQDELRAIVESTREAIVVAPVSAEHA